MVDARTPVIRGIVRGDATQCVLPRGKRLIGSSEAEILLTVKNAPLTSVYLENGTGYFDNVLAQVLARQIIYLLAAKLGILRPV